MITQEKLKQLFTYKKDTGVFTWKSPRSGVTVGTRAGATHYKTGRTRIQVDGKLYEASRLAWLYTYGVLPNECVDHIDRNVSNNSISNLRLATKQQNNVNTTLRKDNTTGFKGVTRKGSKFAAQLTVGKSTLWLGVFKTPEEAYKVYKKTTDEWFGNFNNLEEA
jgi:hypothetical protein